MSALDALDAQVLDVVRRGGVESGGRCGVSSKSIAAQLVRSPTGAGAVIEGRALFTFWKRVQASLRRLRDRGLVESPTGTGLWQATTSRDGVP